MAEAVRMGQAGEALPGTPGRAAHRRNAGTSFHQVLAHAFGAEVAAGSVRPAVHHATARMWAPGKSAASLPATATGALSQAMAAENVPASWEPGLNFIMAQESSGKVDARNPVHSARGLYQLTAANYHYNPHGAASFGNGVEEAQGGIRYIRARYGTADNAVAFWHRHHWY